MSKTGDDPVEVLEEAVRRFRGMSWEVLQRRPDIIWNVREVVSLMVNGGLAGKFEHQLYDMSHPCGLGECDAFVSHSWHDDPALKWYELRRWCNKFRIRHGRTPRLWLDKTCINQNYIEADLRCLPVFLAACNHLLVLAGVTYVTRLWCVMELFVYRQMLENSPESSSGITVVALAHDEDERNKLWTLWADFDAANCECVEPHDKVRFLEIICRSAGGVTGFNDAVISLLLELRDSLRMPTDSTINDDESQPLVIGKPFALTELSTEPPATGDRSSFTEPLAKLCVSIMSSVSSADIVVKSP